jgi:tetratricopeptide (TPR) repeat protein
MMHAVLTQEHMPADLEEAILSRVADNPFFLEELLQLIAEGESSDTNLTIPDNIQDVILARIDRLSRGAKRLVQTAAVLGLSFSRRLLEAIWEGPDDLETCLLELEQRTFCSLRHAEEQVYTFKHALVQEVSYTSLPPARRQTLHAATAQALEVLYATHLEDVSDLIAYHYAQTEQAVKAVEALIRLAEVAARHGVHTEALMALQEAFARIQHLPRDQQPYCRLDLILRRARSLFAKGQLQDALTLLAQQRESLNQLQDTRLDNCYALLLSQIYSRLENWETAAQHAQRVLDATTQDPADAIRGEAFYVLAQERYWSGHLLEGIAFSQQAVDLLKRPEQRAQLGMAHLILGLNTLLVGDFPHALHAADQTRAVGTSIQDPHLLTFADWLTGWAQATCGESESAVQACQRSLETAPDPLSATLALGWLGYAYLEQGEAAEAIPLLQQAVQRMQQFQRRRLESLYTTFLCEAYLARDDLDAARELILHGLSIAQQADYRVGMAWAQRALGRISQATNSPAAAEHHLREALGTFNAMQARFEIGRTHLDLGDLKHLQRNPEATTVHLTKAFKLFEALQVPKYTERTRQRVHDFGLLDSTGTFLSLIGH